MKNSILELLTKNGWNARTPAPKEEIDQLHNKFGGQLPDDYIKVLRFSNGGSLYGFATPFIIFSITEVLSLYREYDLYQNIPQSLIFGGDGGGTLYCFDLRSDKREVIFFKEDDMSYDNIIYQGVSLTETILKVINNEKIN